MFWESVGQVILVFFMLLVVLPAVVISVVVEFSSSSINTVGPIGRVMLKFKAWLFGYRDP